MDFHSLSRRELQALCKRNKIPANITNVAMADALGALPSVEGIEEFLNREGSGVPESPMKEEIVSSDIPQTALRTSTRRKAVKDESITTRTRRAAAARCTEESENRDINVALTTSSLLSGRRRMATASSACKKVDFQKMVDVDKEENDLDQEKNVIEKTPAVPKSHKRVAGASTRRRTDTRNNGAAEQRVYSTRRSIRLLEKNMESLSLGEDVKMEPITVHMSFDEMLNSSGLVKEETKLEIESKKIDESERKLDEGLGLEIDDQEKNEMEFEVKHSENEPEIDLDDPLKCSTENSVTENNSDDSETKAPNDSLDVKCFSEYEEANEVAKTNEAMGISAEQICFSDKFSLPTEDVDLTEVHNTSIAEESGVEVQSKQNESICEAEHIEEVEVMNLSAKELSLPHEIVEEETQAVDVLSSVEEFVMEVKNGQDENADESEPAAIEKEEALNADIEGDKQEMKMEKVSVQAEADDTIIKPMGSPAPENISENLVDVKIRWQSDEAAPKDTNVDAIDLQPKISHDIQCEQALVEVSVTSTEKIIPSSSNISGVQSLPSFAADQLALASQFPRPTLVAIKSPHHDQAVRLLMDNSDSEVENEKEQEREHCVQRKSVEMNNMSLRQLKKMFKEQLQLRKKMDENNNTKVVGQGEVRTALQPLPENRIAMVEMEKKF